MKVELFMLALKPAEPPETDFTVISSNKDNMTIPNFELHQNFPDIPIILEALLKKYIGFDLEYQPEFIIHHAAFNENVLGLYYYTFLPYNTKVKDGCFFNITRLSGTEVFQKLFRKLSII